MRNRTYAARAVSPVIARLHAQREAPSGPLDQSKLNPSLAHVNNKEQIQRELNPTVPTSNNASARTVTTGIPAHRLTYHARHYKTRQ